jgi:hypothetical protein
LSKIIATKLTTCRLIADESGGGERAEGAALSWYEFDSALQAGYNLSNGTKKGQNIASQGVGQDPARTAYPLGITVLTEFELMAEPPKGDILILRRQQPAWTPAQRALLPDGVRDSRASDILLEFKYTESVNREVLCQALGYDTFYRRTQEVANEAAVQTFVLSAKTPAPETLRQFEYQLAEQPGVYRSGNIFVREMPLLVLNELRPEPHNIFVKTFASRYLARKAVLNTLRAVGLQAFPQTVQAVFNFLWRQWQMKAETMELEEVEISLEELIELGKEWQGLMLASLPAEEVLTHFKPEERLAGLEPEEVLTHFKPEERLAGLPIEEIEAYLRRLKRGENFSEQ